MLYNGVCNDVRPEKVTDSQKEETTRQSESKKGKNRLKKGFIFEHNSKSEI